MTSQYNEEIKVGIVQTRVNKDRAWLTNSDYPHISTEEENNVWYEICKAIRTFYTDGLRPQLVVFPELTLPNSRINDFTRIICKLNTIAIAGLDYTIIDSDSHVVKNQGIVIIPKNINKEHPSSTSCKVLFGKTFPAPGEEKKLNEMSPSWSFQGDQTVYIFDYAEYGRIGVSICYDFMDIERALMYRGKIQHLIVIAYNRDIEMFKSLALSLSRTVYCNVIICNTGFWGGSIVISPFYDKDKRVVFGSDGNNSFVAQVISLPVSKLIHTQESGPTRIDISSHSQDFKDPPPGFHNITNT
jgi:predicted amidohydrolase